MLTDEEESETRRLRAVHALELLDTPPEERFDRVTTLCARLFGTQGAAITLIDRDRQFAKSWIGLDVNVPREHSFCTYALQDERTLVVEDATVDPRFAENPLVTDDPNLRFYAGQRLLAPGGQPVGALCIYGSEPRTLSDEDRRLLRDLALWVEKEMAVDDELERAVAVQRGLLPTTPPGLDAWQIAGDCVPSREVGGDLLDWYRQPRGVAVTIADVMGKGMSAAIMMATLRAVLRAGTRTGDLASAIAAAAQTMEDDFAGTGAFATIFHAELDPDSGRLTYVDAGHGLAVLRRADGRIQRTTSGGRIVVARSMAAVDETLADARRVLAAVGFGATGLIGLLSWAAIRRAFAPIEGMIGTADRIAAGDLAERTAVADDGSEVGRLGSALDRMLDRIEEAVDAKTASEERMRRFVADASHELRTPLTSVRGYAELYRQGARDEATVATSMARIEGEAARMGRLVDDLLALARMDRDEPAHRREPVDLGRVAGEAVDAARVVDGTRTWDLDVPAAPDAVVAGDAAQLRQVVDNLLANARAHTPPGTTVATTVDVDDGRVRLKVRDDGPGIPPADRERAFDRFWRATRSDENPVAGSGLGLAIVRSIARAHGGEATLGDGTGGRGTTVRVELPRLSS